MDKESARQKLVELESNEVYDTSDDGDLILLPLVIEKYCLQAYLVDKNAIDLSFEIQDYLQNLVRQNPTNNRLRSVINMFIAKNASTNLSKIDQVVRQVYGEELVERTLALQNIKVVRGYNTKK